MENTNQYTGLPSPQPFAGMYIIINPINGNVEGISSSPMNREDEIWVSKEEYGEDYMWLSNMRLVDGQWVEKPKMKTVWRMADGSSGMIEEGEDLGEGWTEVECPQGMRKPVWYEGEWVEEGEKKVREENKKLKSTIASQEEELFNTQIGLADVYEQMVGGGL